MLASFAEFERMRIRERIAEGKTGHLGLDDFLARRSG